jgi:site-specific recombinase XerD
MPLEVTYEDFLAPPQVRDLKAYCRLRAEAASPSARGNPVRNWAILHVALDTGLRVSELCALQLRDVILDAGHASLIVRDGKGGKKRGVKVGTSLQEHLAQFIRWKQTSREPIAAGDPLFASSRGGPLTRTAVYRIFRNCADAVSIPKRFSIHSCRHTYASMLYRASGYNLRLVQKQLGHRSIQTTQIYADVLDEDAVVAVENLPQ